MCYHLNKGLIMKYKSLKGLIKYYNLKDGDAWTNIENSLIK